MAMTYARSQRRVMAPGTSELRSLRVPSSRRECLSRRARSRPLSGIANCYNDELTVRAADVCLKERRRVVLLLRETPLHAGHIALMAQATLNGAIIMPPVLPSIIARKPSMTLSTRPWRALDLFDMPLSITKRWQGHSTRTTP